MQARGIYNLKLAVFETEESGNIVPNDLDFDRERRVYILTGATVVERRRSHRRSDSCLCLAQGDIYIPGKSFVFSTVTGIYTYLSGR